MMHMGGYKLEDLPIRDWVKTLVPVSATKHGRYLRGLLCKVLWCYIARNHPILSEDLRRLTLQYQLYPQVENDIFFSWRDLPDVMIGHPIGNAPFSKFEHLICYMECHHQQSTQGARILHWEADLTYLAEAEILRHVYVLKYFKLYTHITECCKYTSEDRYETLQDVKKALWKWSHLRSQQPPVTESTNIQRIVNFYQLWSAEDTIQVAAKMLGFTVDASTQRIYSLKLCRCIFLRVAFKEPNNNVDDIKVCGSACQLGDNNPAHATRMERVGKNKWELKLTLQSETVTLWFIYPDSPGTEITLKVSRIPECRSFWL